MRDLPQRPDDLLELFEIDLTATAAPETARPEPVLAPFLAKFGDPAQRATGRLDDSRLDDSRARAEPERQRRAPPMPRRPVLALGLIFSLGVHLLPLLVLLNWNSAPAEIAAPIPVQLVVEEPPAPPPPPPQAEKPPPPGRLASEDFGETKAEPDHSALAGREADKPSEAQPAEMVLAAALPPPKPIPPPELVSALPKPGPPPEPAAMPDEAKPAPPVMPPVKQAVVARLAPNPRPPPRAQVPGPAATRDEYLAYCMSLIRRHFGPLSPAFLAGRHGATVLRIVVRDDGTIARIAIAQGSPHPDIDARIEEAVAAVRRFPPLPQWFQEPRISLTLQVSYPGGL
jgi:TonB family protein